MSCVTRLGLNDGAKLWISFLLKSVKKAKNLGKKFLLLRMANNLGKIGGNHDFQSKGINFNAKKGKNLGKIGGSK